MSVDGDSRGVTRVVLLSYRVALLSYRVALLSYDGSFIELQGSFIELRIHVSTLVDEGMSYGRLYDYYDFYDTIRPMNVWRGWWRLGGSGRAGNVWGE